MISATCSALLAAGAGFHPLYGDRLSNHLPMALIALDAMGASPDQLQQFAAHYSTRLVQRGAVRQAVDPAICVGVSSSFEEVHRSFVEQIAAEGVDATLRIWVTPLMSGVSASAFHALIRLAYGIEADNPGEIALALAYWTVEHQPLLGVGEQTTPETVPQIAATTAQAVAGNHFRPGIIIDRMNEIAALRSVRRSCLQPEHIDLQDLAEFALDVYAARDDFTLLHLVTACHAARIVLPFADDATLATRYLWEALLIAYLTTSPSGTVEIGSTAALWSLDPHHSWQPCLQAAITSKDDHIIKLTYTAWQEFQRTRDPLYLYITWRKTFGLR